MSGTIVDPGGLPYANGTITPILVTTASPTFTATHLPYTPPTSATGLNGAGSFVMQLADNTQLSPGGTTWNFVVNCAQGCVPPAGGKGPVSFTLSGITISGGAQNISGQLQAIAPVLSSITNPTFPTPANATEATNTVTLTTVSGVFPAAYVSGATISVVQCSVAGYNISAAITGGGAGGSTLTYTDPTGSLGPATGCIANVIIGSTTPTFATVLSGTNPNALLESGTLGPTGGGTINANQVNGAAVPAAAAFTGTSGSQFIPAACTAGQILVGNASNLAVCQPLTGDSSITNGGVMTNVKINGTSLAALSTGPLCNTTGTGVPFICAAGNFPVLNQNTTGNAATATTATSAAGLNGTALGSLATGPLCNTTSTGLPFICTGTQLAPPLSGFALNPSSTGRANAGDSPYCNVDGGTHPTIASCVTFLNGLSSNAQSGIITSTIPEDFAQPFSGGFSGTVILGNGLGTGYCSSAANAAFQGNCWTVEQPLIIPSGMQIRGGGLAQQTNDSKGTPITFGANFPSALGAPATPAALMCNLSGGALSNNPVGQPYVVSVTEVNNAMGGTTAPKTPMYSRHNANLVSCGNGGTAQSITFTMPGPLTSSNASFNAVDLSVYTTVSQGQATVDTNSASQSGHVITFTRAAGWGTVAGAGNEIIVTGCSNSTLNSSAQALGTNTWFVTEATQTAGLVTSLIVYNTVSQTVTNVSNCLVTGISVPFQNIGSSGGVPADSDMACPGNVGSLDNNGCLGTGQFGTGQVTIKQISDVSIAGGCLPVSPQQTSDCNGRLDVPQALVDLSNPMIIFSRASAQQFDTDLRDITLDGSPSSVSASVPLSNEPGVLWENFNAQEQSGAQGLTIMGAAGGAFLYAWGGPIHLDGINIGSGAGPAANQQFTGLVCDANRYNIGSCARNIRDGSFNPHGGSGSGENVIASIYFTGNDAALSGNGIGTTSLVLGTHAESGSIQPTTCYLIANAANVIFQNSGCNATANSAGIHIGSTAGQVSIFGTKCGINPTINCKTPIQDDANGFIAPQASPSGRTQSYTTDLQIFNLTSLFTKGKRYTVDSATTLTSGAFAVGGGWGTTASLAITVATSKDSAAIVTLTSNGTGQAANPTLALTFVDGTWTNVPVCEMSDSGGTGAIANVTVLSRSATVYTWQWNATPVAGLTYEFTISCQGT